MAHIETMHCERCGSVMQEVDNPSLVGNLLKRKFECQNCQHATYKDTTLGATTTLLAVFTGSLAVIKGLGWDRSGDPDQQ